MFCDSDIYIEIKKCISLILVPEYQNWLPIARSVVIVAADVVTLHAFEIL